MRISNRQLEIPSLILLVNIETNFNEVKFPTPWSHVWQTWPTHSLTISNGFSCCLFPPYFKPIQSYQRLSVSVEKLVYSYTEYQLHLFLSLINRQEKSTTEILERTEGFPTVIDLWGFSDWPVCEFFFFSKVMPWCTVWSRQDSSSWWHKPKRFKHPLLFSSGNQITPSFRGPFPGLWI